MKSNSPMHVSQVSYISQNQSVPGSQIVGLVRTERERENNTRAGAWRKRPQHPRVLFSALVFSIRAFPTIPEPGTGYFAIGRDIKFSSKRLLKEEPRKQARRKHTNCWFAFCLFCLPIFFLLQWHPDITNPYTTKTSVSDESYQPSNSKMYGKEP